MAGGRLDDPALARLWDAVAERLQRNGLSPRGVIVIDGLDRSERFALTGLVGRQVGERARVDLAALDSRIRAVGAAPGLVAAASARRGPLVDRPGKRAVAAAQRTTTAEAARAGLSAYGLENRPWVEPWLEAARAVVARARPGQGPVVITAAVRCIASLPWDGPQCGRTELANRVAGNSHALDDGTVLAALVLRAVAMITGVALPVTPTERRALWERAGVLGDEVSTLSSPSACSRPGPRRPRWRFGPAVRPGMRRT